MKYIFMEIKSNNDIDDTIKSISLLGNSIEFHYWLNIDNEQIKNELRRTINTIRRESYEYLFTNHKTYFNKYKNIKFHNCYFSSDIKPEDELKPLSSSEVFVFINEYNVSSKLISVIKQSGCKICLSISPIFVKEEQVKLYRELVNIYSKIQNKSLYEHDLELENPTIAENFYFNSENKINELKLLIMGYHGDYISEDSLEETNSINIKNLMRDKECSSCDYLTRCSERGIGYIREKNKINSCLGLKLYMKGT